MGLASRLGDCGSILTTTDSTGFGENAIQLSCAQSPKWRLPIQLRLGPLQPLGLDQIGHEQRGQHLGQAGDHAVGPIGIKLPEGKSPLALFADRQQTYGLQAIQRSLAVAHGKQARPFISADAVLQQIMAPRKARLKSLEFEPCRIVRCGPQPLRDL